jgi:hypothetical protein
VSITTSTWEDEVQGKAARPCLKNKEKNWRKKKAIRVLA